MTIFGPASLNAEIRQDGGFSVAVGMTAQDSCDTLRMCLHKIENYVSDRFTSEVGEKLVIRNTPFVPTCVSERWNMGQYEHVAETSQCGW